MHDPEEAQPGIAINLGLEPPCFLQTPLFSEFVVRTVETVGVSAV